MTQLNDFTCNVHCDDITTLDSRITTLQSETNALSKIIDEKLSRMRFDLDVFRRWLIGIFVVTMFTSTGVGLLKINEEFKQVREGLHQLELKIIKLHNK